MKRNNQRGFILTETIIVSGIILIAFGLLYSQFFTLYAKYETIEKYDTIDGIYSAKQVKNLIQENSNALTFFAMAMPTVLTASEPFYDMTTCPILANQPYCLSMLDALDIKRVIVTKYNLTDVKKIGTYTQNFEYALQEYIKYLPVGSEIVNNGYRLILSFNDGTFSSIDIMNDNVAPYSGMFFNGYTSNVEVDIDIPDTCTIEAWGKFTGASIANRMLWSLDSENYNAGPDLYFSGSKLMLNTGDSLNNLFSGTLSYPSINVWNHYAVTFDKANNTSKLYINGIYAGSADYRNPKGSKLFLGTYNNEDRYNWNGYIKEVRVWDTVRTQDEIQKNMDKSITKTNNDLIGYYPLYTSPTDVVYDTSGRNNNGIANSLTKIKGLSFDGSDDYVDITPSAAIPTVLTIEAWAYADTYMDGVYCKMLWSFDYNGATESGPDLYFCNNVISLNKGDGSANVYTGSYYPTLYEWHHYAVVIDSVNNYSKLYIDGKYIGQAAYRSPTGWKLYLGRYDATGTGYNWNGYIKDVRLWNDVRTATEIKDNMNKVISFSSSNLVLYYPFTYTTGESSTTLYNRVSANSHGTINGAVWWIW